MKSLFNQFQEFSLLNDIACLLIQAACSHSTTCRFSSLACGLSINTRSSDVEPFHEVWNCANASKIERLMVKDYVLLQQWIKLCKTFNDCKLKLMHTMFANINLPVGRLILANNFIISAIYTTILWWPLLSIILIGIHIHTYMFGTVHACPVKHVWVCLHVGDAYTSQYFSSCPFQKRMRKVVNYLHTLLY